MNVIQFVVTRSTCAQQDNISACRTALTVRILTFGQMLESFDPVVVNTDTTQWTVKMPQMHIR
eukprot:3255235-Prymnesium_polylepis.1